MALKKFLTKKKLIVFLISIVLFIFVYTYSKKSINNFDDIVISHESALYAISLDGKTVDEIPSKGQYEVKVTCENAVGEWDYDKWELKVNKMNSNSVFCSIAFQSTQKVYLNEYVTSLKDTTQGDGKVINEIADIYKYDTAQKISQSEYKNVTTFYSNSSNSTSGTLIDNAFSFVNDEWVTNPNSMTSNTYYHLKFNVSEDGYYQVCFDMSAGSTTNQIYIYNGTIIAMEGAGLRGANNTSVTSDCYTIGYIKTTDNLRIVQRAYSETKNSTVYPISKINFSVEKMDGYQEDTGIRYEGFNPNNYVWFNNEYWRIIGVFDETSHGQEGEKLVKLIRNDSLGGFALNKTNVNDWSQSTLKQLLNGAYYNAQDGTDTEFCYGHSNINKYCNYTKTGINDLYRPMVKNVTWYLGGYGTNTRRADDYYQFERGNLVYSGRPTTTTGYIGLMYVSDYGYSALEDTCSRITRVSSYSSNNCAGKSWLFGSWHQWTITPYSANSSYVFYIYYYGSLLSTSAGSGLGVRPVLYLDSSVYKVAGDGSYENPYIIGMD